MHNKHRYILLKSLGNLFTFFIILLNAISIFINKDTGTISTITIVLMLILTSFLNIYLSNIDFRKIGEDSLIISDYKEALKQLTEKNDYIISRNNKLEIIRLNYKQDIDKARKMLSSIVPQKLPNDRNLSSSFIYQPIEAVGGDYYDFINISKNKILFIIADITGHGIEAAIVIPMVKAAFFMFAKEGKTTNKILEEMNDFLVTILPKNYFLTACLVEIDLNIKKIKYTNASHTAFILKREDKIFEFESNNTLIGLFPKATFEENELELLKDDSLLFYTDGVIEASLSKNKYDFYGVENLKKAFLNSNNKNAKTILKEIEKDFYEYLSYKTPDDDCSIVVFKILK